MPFVLLNFLPINNSFTSSSESLTLVTLEILFLSNPILRHLIESLLFSEAKILLQEYDIGMVNVPTPQYNSRISSALSMNSTTFLTI